ncbi:MAG: anti-sigma factor family protein [Sphingobacteriales bacterium]
MNINRNNYEEYFLLYTDNELSDAEKKAVEQFVNENSDLLEEFRNFQQIILTPDSIHFINKAALMKTEPFINASNYEEYFLLYADNELSAEEIKEVEKFTASSPAMQQEFDLMQQAILIADNNIVFPDKTFLYKKEEPRRVLPISWMRFAAAAVFIGIILTAGILFFNKTPIDKGPVIVKKELPSNNTILQPKENSVINQQSTEEKNIAAVDDKKNDDDVKQKDNTPKSTQQNITVVNSNAKENKKQVVPVTNQNSIASSLIKANESKDLGKQFESVGNVAIVTQPNEIGAKADVPKGIIANPVEIVDKAVGPETINENALTTSYKEEENRTSIGVFSVSDDKVQKSGLRGLFRKVKRLVDRRGNNNEEKDKKLYIGSFAIALAK